MESSICRNYHNKVQDEDHRKSLWSKMQHLSVWLMKRAFKGIREF